MWKIFVRINIAIILLAAFISMALVGYQKSLLSRRVPTHIDVNVAYVQTNFSLWQILTPMRHENCGGAVFKVGDKSLAAINADGIAYLNKDLRNSDRETLESWLPTPATDKNSS